MPSLLAQAGPATISGTAFRDLDGDGARDNREQGEPNITISAYDGQNGLVATAITDISGNYVLNAELDKDKIVRGANYRVVFSGWPSSLYPGPHGEDSGTEIQYVVGGATNVNFGLFSPGQYIPPEPTLFAFQTRQATVLPPTPASAPTLWRTATPSSPLGTPTSVYEGIMPAPEFAGGLEWLNVHRPLTLSDLRGKVILLEFWTYGCISSTRVIPDLKLLQKKYAQELVVIGVHAAKYPHESETENIRRIIERDGITYPVVNDKKYEIAKALGANVWPTFALINPAGRYMGSRSGDLAYSDLDILISQTIKTFDARKQIDRNSIDHLLVLPTASDSPLRFPSAVWADETNNRLFIADANHNRIVVTDLAGVVQEVIGGGNPGLRDGDFQTATFFRPQGLALADATTLYVADTYNHALRRINLSARKVETIAGTGQPFSLRQSSNIATQTSLSFPWDVRIVNGLVYLTMTGQHQIWTYDPIAKQIKPFAGSGVEQLLDGYLLSAGFSQPTALAADGSTLYIADSEANAIRQADSVSGTVKTIVGKGFYEFGDMDGLGTAVLLQRPAGVAYKDGTLYVADTYNNKIKMINLQTRESRTFVGSGKSGNQDGNAPLFDEPSGLSVTRDKLYIADTNNHSIRVVNLITRQVTTLMLTDAKGILMYR